MTNHLLYFLQSLSFRGEQALAKLGETFSDNHLLHQKTSAALLFECNSVAESGQVSATHLKNGIKMLSMILKKSDWGEGVRSVA